jgi:predicted anti-sigma-YlaC factor YlaD
MRCKEIQELLKADYFDGESSSKQQGQIKEHLGRCAQCRKLEAELQSQRLLFQKVKQEVPARVWDNIRDAIITEGLNQERGLSAGVLDWLRRNLFAPRPAFALASALTVIIFALFFAGSLMQKRQSLSRQTSAEEAIVGYSLNGEGNGSLYDLGTDIEEYFL